MLTDSVYVIAEAGVNHNGSLDFARSMVNVAACAGADAVKFQTFVPERLVARTAPKADYQLKNTQSDESQFEMLSKLRLDESAHFELRNLCEKMGIDFLSTPFDIESLDFLATKLHVPRVKLASGEITNAPLLLSAARYDKPIILSTGMSTLKEVETALSVLAFGYLQSDVPPSLLEFERAFRSASGQAKLQSNVTLLQCTSDYPASLDDVNLRAMDTLRHHFSVSVGFSDHTQGVTASVAAAARGASVIEKHFTLDKNLSGPDHKASLEPDELKFMIDQIRQVQRALGSHEKTVTESELNSRAIARRGLVASREIAKGELFSVHNLAAKRPGSGIAPIHFWEMLGKPAKRNYLKDENVDL